MFISAATKCAICCVAWCKFFFTVLILIDVWLKVKQLYDDFSIRHLLHGSRVCLVFVSALIRTENSKLKVQTFTKLYIKP